MFKWRVKHHPRKRGDFRKQKKWILGVSFTTEEEGRWVRRDGPKKSYGGKKPENIRDRPK